MSDEVWNVESLRQFTLRLLDDHEKRLVEIVNRIDARHSQFDHQAERLAVAANEWRGALQDRERATVSRIEFDTRTKALEEKSDTAAATNAALLAALGVEMRVGFKAIEDKTTQALETLRLRNAEHTGGRESLNDLRVWALGAAAFIASIAAIVATVVALTQ